MNIHTRMVGKVTILELKGELLVGEAEQIFRDRIEKLRDADTRNLAVNLASVTKLDSSGIGALVHAFASFRKAGGKCRFYAAPKHVKQLLKMVMLDTVLDLAEDEASALAKF